MDLALDIDGQGRARIDTGCGFLDHMLSLLAAHASFDLSVKAQGDIRVDYHHLTEDVGICLGQALSEALGTKEGISRYGHALAPMDESLTTVAVDISGRPHLTFNVPMPAEKVGDFDTELVADFLQALANRGHLTLHVNLMYGRNAHHIIESVFKSFGRALREAASGDGRTSGVPSTKGML